MNNAFLYFHYCKVLLQWKKNNSNLGSKREHCFLLIMVKNGLKFLMWILIKILTQQIGRVNSRGLLGFNGGMRSTECHSSYWNHERSQFITQDVSVKCKVKLYTLRSEVRCFILLPWHRSPHSLLGRAWRTKSKTKTKAVPFLRNTEKTETWWSMLAG